jgi:tripartite-type tricarboxylate transporter receptor subunit TctC
MPGVAIPLKSSAEMMLCVIQENCLISIADGPPAVPQIKDGNVRALAVTGADRSPELPDVPSMAEAGFPEVNTKLWSGFFAPAATPPAIAKKLEAALARAIKDPDVNAKLKGMAVTPGGGSSDDFRKMIDADIQTYVEVVKAANLKFE